jgi:DNA-binding NtrC family response regulator
MAKVFVIDDTAPVLEIAQIVLSQAGYDVQTFISAKEALEAMETQPVDVIVTDIYMPDEDGLEVIRDARRICPETPIVAMSGITGELNMLSVSHLLGACCTLQKPFSRTQLLEAVAYALEGRDSRTRGSNPS